MSIRFLTRFLLTTKKILPSSGLSRSYTSLPTPHSSLSPLYTGSLLRLRSLFGVAVNFRHIPSVATGVRSFATSQKSLYYGSSLCDKPEPEPELSWFDEPGFSNCAVMMNEPKGKPTKKEIIRSYVKTLAMLLGSESEAERSIYAVSTKNPFLFACHVDTKLKDDLAALPQVWAVFPDYDLDVNCDKYGGQPFLNGRVVPKGKMRKNARVINEEEKVIERKDFDIVKYFKTKKKHNGGNGLKNGAKHGNTTKQKILDQNNKASSMAGGNL